MAQWLVEHFGMRSAGHYIASRIHAFFMDGQQRLKFDNPAATMPICQHEPFNFHPRLLSPTSKRTRERLGG